MLVTALVPWTLTTSVPAPRSTSSRSTPKYSIPSISESTTTVVLGLSTSTLKNGTPVPPRVSRSRPWKYTTNTTPSVLTKRSTTMSSANCEPRIASWRAFSTSSADIAAVMLVVQAVCVTSTPLFVSARRNVLLPITVTVSTSLTAASEVPSVWVQANTSWLAPARSWGTSLPAHTLSAKRTKNRRLPSGPTSSTPTSTSRNASSDSIACSIAAAIAASPATIAISAVTWTTSGWPPLPGNVTLIVNVPVAPPSISTTWISLVVVLAVPCVRVPVVAVAEAPSAGSVPVPSTGATSGLSGAPF